MATESVIHKSDESAAEAPKAADVKKTYTPEYLAEHRALMARVLEDGGKRIRRSVERLEALGFYDKDGNRLKRELPADMQPGADRDCVCDGKAAEVLRAREVLAGCRLTGILRCKSRVPQAQSASLEDLGKHDIRASGQRAYGRTAGAFSILAHESLSGSVRLNTRRSGVESGSTRKYPTRSN